MAPERWQQVESLFHAARERVAEDRDAWLSAACQGDDTLRREVESLLRHQGDSLENGLAPAAARLVELKAPGQHEGRTFGPYVLGRLLGAGGMGEVYRAHDSRLGRDVAVKVLSDTIQHDPARATRFEREARVLAALNHPHIAAIYGLEECDGIRGLVMELVEGETLAERLATGPVRPHDAWTIGAQIADALGAAHEKGIVHRDLKPANIKITTGSIVKVLDFGLAKAVLDSDHTPTVAVTKTREGIVIGTAPYMSPEQARGLNVDSRGDIWAFGCVLYEMLAGQRAFDGDSTVDVLAAVVHREPDFTKLPRGTPRAIRALLRQCLSKDPAQRPGNINLVRAQLASIGGTPETRRNLALASIAGAVVVGAVGFMWLGTQALRDRAGVRPSRDSRPDVAMLAALKPVLITSSKGFDGFVEFAPDGTSVAFSSDRAGSMEIFVQGLASGSSPQQLTANGRQNVQPSWSADGQFIAYCELVGGGIWIMPSRGGTARKVSEFGSHPRWSPDGRRIVFQEWPLTELHSLGVPEGLSTLWTVDVSGGTPPVRLTNRGAPAGSHRSPAWFRDSERVMFAVGGPGGAITLWVVGGPDLQPRQIADNGKLTGLFVLAPDGRSVYFKARDGHSIWWLPLSETGEAAGEPLPTGLPLTGAAIQQLTMSPDGRHVGWTVLEQTANVWSAGLGTDATKSRLLPLTDGSGVRYGLPAVAADGRVAMVGSRPGSASSLFLLAPPAPLRQLTTDSPGRGSPRWMPGDTEIAYITDRGEGPGFWAIDPASGQERLLFPFSALPRPPGGGQPILTGAALSTALSADFTGFAFAVVQNGIPNIWVASLNRSGPTGKLVQRTFEAQAGTYPSWSPDGQWLAYQCSDGGDTQLCLTGATSGDCVQLTRGSGQSWTGGWSPGGDDILIAARRDGIWNVGSVSRASRSVRMLTHFSEPRFYVRFPRWDRANNRVVFERFEATGKIWSVELPAPR